MPHALVLPALILAIVLAVSGVSKLIRPATTLAGMRSLALPEWLTRPLVARVVPLVEIALAILVVVGAGWLAEAAALAVLILFGLYGVIIVRAVRSGVDSRCACFGSLTDDAVSGWTVARNAVLFALAAITVAAAFAGPSVLDRLTSMTGDEWWWLVGAVVTATSAALVVGHGGAQTPAADDTDPQDYLRFPIPFGVLQQRDGGHPTLRGLAATRARLLVFISLDCSACKIVLKDLPAWSRDLEAVAVHPVIWSDVDRFVTEQPDLADQLLVDEGMGVVHLFEIDAQPAAVLLGADGLLAGGPVTGAESIQELVHDLTEQLQAANS